MDLALLARGPFHEPRMTVRAREKIDQSKSQLVAPTIA
jgi:hypothetical protein